MSTTYSIVCDDCKISCWIGQSKTIYKYKYIADFFNNHVGHRLRYLNDHAENGVDDYEEIDEPYEDNQKY